MHVNHYAAYLQFTAQLVPKVSAIQIIPNYIHLFIHLTLVTALCWSGSQLIQRLS